MEARQFFRVWKDVFGRWRYVLLALFIALFFYSLHVLISNWGVLSGFYSSSGFSKTLNLFLVLFWGFSKILTTASFVALVIISVLFGILFSMLIYKAHFHLSLKDEEAGLLGGIGAFLAAFIPGCAACGIGVASALGIGAGVLAFLPYKGFELSIISIIIMTIAIFKTIENMYVCALPLSKSKK